MMKLECHLENMLSRYESLLISSHENNEYVQITLGEHIAVVRLLDIQNALMLLAYSAGSIGGNELNWDNSLEGDGEMKGEDE